MIDETASVRDVAALRLRTLIEHVQGAVLVADEHQHVLVANTAFCALLRTPVRPEQLVGVHCATCSEAMKHLFPDTDDFVWRTSELMQSRQTLLNEQLRLHDGRTFERDYVPVSFGAQNHGHMWVYRDITQRKQDETALQRAQRILHSFFDNAGVMMGIVELLDDDIVHIYDNAATATFHRTTPEAMRNQSERTMGTPRDIVRTWLAAYRQSEQTDRPVQFEFEYEAGSIALFLSATVAYIGVSSRGRTRCSYVVQDITERKRYERQVQAYQLQLEEMNVKLLRLATIDDLTGLKNRGDFNTQLAMAVGHAHWYHIPLSMLMIDIDFFKQYNDTFGHPAGDEVITAVGRILRQHARASDYLARYGGEELVILLPNTGASAAALIAERFRAAVEAERWPHRAITISLGVAPLSESHTAGTMLTQAADRALYQAKRAGRNRVAVAEAKIEPR
ncbi:MAG: sensor domain-containing diguanylate cyclase [Roseiflexaceae bacterium]|nr:sensor domain-containing diguanylate cyclase [Roseiflexaceae bacterium]